VSTAPLARILVVDDERDLVTALCRTLEAQGYSTTGAASGPQALDALRSAAAVDATRFDVLITDLMMPAMDGIALLRAAQDIDANLVSIVMTGHGTIHTAVEALKSGALDYILKPFNLRVALPVLSRALALRQLRLDNAVLLQQVADRTVELEESNRQLQAANEDLDAYNSSVSHDLRGHLNRIIGFSQLLSDSRTGTLNAQQSEFLDYVCVGGQQLLRLTDDLLRFARLGRQSVTKERVAVGPLVHEICRELRSGTPERIVDLRVGDLPDVSADPSLLRQVLVNLLSNALKFTERVPEPIVAVTGQLRAGEVTYSIRDNGAGFDMIHAGRLFSSFQRLHTESEFEGTGLGLAIVQRIIKRHGGTISAQAAVDKGAVFTFTLPA
jgi:two-component system sensor histidine kinase/response regulator